MANNTVDKLIFESAMTRNAASMQGQTENYFRWNLNIFPIEKNKRILDLGSGPGMYLRQIMAYAPSFYMAVDNNATYLEQIRLAFEKRPGCKTLQLDLTDPMIADLLGGYSFDYVLFFDVLEHMEDEKQALRNIHNLMKSCRTRVLFLRVPALQFIYGTNDRAIGHYRRYSAKSLMKLLESCSFQVDLIRYQNFIAIPLWYIIGNVFKRALAVSNAEGSIFNHMVPAIRFMETVIHPPIGLSLYCICTIRK